MAVCPTASDTRSRRGCRCRTADRDDRRGIARATCTEACREPHPHASIQPRIVSHIASGYPRSRASRSASSRRRRGPLFRPCPGNRPRYRRHRGWPSEARPRPDWGCRGRLESDRRCLHRRKCRVRAGVATCVPGRLPPACVPSVSPPSVKTAGRDRWRADEEWASHHHSHRRRTAPRAWRYQNRGPLRCSRRVDSARARCCRA